MKVYCILGDERALQTKSPAMFSTVIRKHGISGAYVPLKVEPGKVGQAMQSLRTLNIAGANVTVPYKEAVVTHMDILSEGANIIGAVNTIVRNKNELKGYNTNAIGFMDTLGDVGFEVEGKTALVFGTGGVARAVVFIFNWLRTGNIIVAGRDSQKAQSIVNTFRGEAATIEAIAEQSVTADIIVNATSVSSPGESMELAALAGKMEVTGCEMFIDLNYGRIENFWKDMAERNGIRFMDGLSTLANQAARTLALWTGARIPPGEFLKAAEAPKFL